MGRKKGEGTCLTKTQSVVSEIIRTHEETCCHSFHKPQVQHARGHGADLLMGGVRCEDADIHAILVVDRTRADEDGERPSHG
jgi:hypothetical protein